MPQCAAMTSVFSSFSSWGNPASRHGRINSWDEAKLLALLLMIVDHIGFFFFPDQEPWRALGRGAAPIFLFLTGFAPAHRLRKDLIFCAAALWVVNFYISGHVLLLNILFLILFGRVLMQALERGRLKIRRPMEWLAVLTLVLPTTCLVQYGSMGLYFTVFGYLQRHSERYPARTRALFLGWALLLHGLFQIWVFHMSALGALLAAATLAAIGVYLWRFQVRPWTLPSSVASLEPALCFLSRHTLWIYTLHLAGMMLLTGKGY